MKYEKSLRSLNKPKPNPNARSIYLEPSEKDIEKSMQNNNFKVPNSVNTAGKSGFNSKKNLKSLNANAKKKKKNKSNRKKDEENILSKDIDVEEEMKELERMTENKGFKPRDLTNVNISKNYIKNIKFKPMKYKGNFLPYHLRWIFHNTVKSNEIVLIQEIEALENEILRLKQMKMMNREFRKTASLPFGVSSNPCPCCKRVEKRKHECTHEFCESNCPKKRTETNSALAEMLPPNLSFLLNQANNPLKKKIFQGGKPVIFGLKTKEDETNSANNANNPNFTYSNSNMFAEGNFEKENSSAMNFNNIFSTVPGKNPIFISNTHLPNTNLFKSVQVPLDVKNTVNGVNNSFDSGSNLNSHQDKHNSADKGFSGHSSTGNLNADKKFFFMVKK